MGVFVGHSRGVIPNAAEHYRQALVIDPNHQESRHQLSRLLSLQPEPDAP